MCGEETSVKEEPMELDSWAICGGWGARLGGC